MYCCYWNHHAQHRGLCPPPPLLALLHPASPLLPNLHPLQKGRSRMTDADDA